METATKALKDLNPGHAPQRPRRNPASLKDRARAQAYANCQGQSATPKSPKAQSSRRKGLMSSWEGLFIALRWAAGASGQGRPVGTLPVLVTVRDARSARRAGSTALAHARVAGQVKSHGRCANSNSTTRELTRDRFAETPGGQARQRFGRSLKAGLPRSLRLVLQRDLKLRMFVQLRFKSRVRRRKLLLVVQPNRAHAHRTQHSQCKCKAEAPAIDLVDQGLDRFRRSVSSGVQLSRELLECEAAPNHLCANDAPRLIRRDGGLLSGDSLIVGGFGRLCVRHFESNARRKPREANKTLT